MINIKTKTNESVCNKGKVCLRQTVALHRKTLSRGKKQLCGIYKVKLMAEEKWHWLDKLGLELPPLC